MKIKIAELRSLIRESLNEGHARITSEEVEAWKKGDWGFVSSSDDSQQHDDPERFLHGHESGHAHDDEGYMVKSNLYSMKKMAEEVCELVKPGDQLPGWVQELLAISHENLSHVHRYLTGDEALRHYDKKKV